MINIEQRTLTTGEFVYYLSNKKYFIGSVVKYKKKWMFEPNDEVAFSAKDLKDVAKIIKGFD